MRQSAVIHLGDPALPICSSRRLLFGERAALDAGGCVVRLVGLYHALRGAHTFFLRAGEVDRWGGYIINLIHYEDAASLCLAVRGWQASRVLVHT